MGDMAPLLLGMESWVLLSSDRFPALLPTLLAIVGTVTLAVLATAAEPLSISNGVLSALPLTPLVGSDDNNRQKEQITVICKNNQLSI